MNLRLLVLAIFGMILFSSCGGDDCVQADWLGTFTGTQNCGEEAGGETATSLVITAGSSEDKILIDGEELTINGCKATGSVVDPLIGEATYDFELDGNSITGEVSISFIGIPITCTASLTK